MSRSLRDERGGLDSFNLLRVCMYSAGSFMSSANNMLPKDCGELGLGDSGQDMGLNLHSSVLALIHTPKKPFCTCAMQYYTVCF